MPGSLGLALAPQAASAYTLPQTHFSPSGQFFILNPAPESEAAAARAAAVAAQRGQTDRARCFQGSLAVLGQDRSG